MNVVPRNKSFSWSYSRLKNFETCPRRYEAVELKKTVEPERSIQLDRGDALHAAMYSRVTSGEKLPAQFLYMEKWGERFTRALHPLQIIQCELKLSTDKDGNSTGYFDKTTWLRGLIDYFRLLPGKHGEDYGHIVDYKTGKPPKIWDGTQLLINAYLIFMHFKNMKKVRVDYLWTEYDDTTHETFTREDTPAAFAAILPRVTAMEEAHATDVFPPKPCGLCFEYCPVSSCEHYGKRMGR